MEIRNSNSFQTRTIKDEVRLYRQWRDESRERQQWSSWNNSPIAGMLAFAIERGWIPKNLLWVLTGFAIGLVTLAIFVPLTGSRSVLVYFNVGFLMLTVAYWQYRMKNCSRLLFIGSLPLTLLIVVLALSLVL